MKRARSIRQNRPLKMVENLIFSCFTLKMPTAISKAIWVAPGYKRNRRRLKVVLQVGPGRPDRRGFDLIDNSVYAGTQC